MKKERLFIIVPKGGFLEKYLSRFPHVYKRNASTPQFVYFAYFGDQSPKEKACNLLLIFDFKDFSLDKETNFYRLKVNVE